MRRADHKTEPAGILLSMASFVIMVAGMSAAKSILVPFLLAAFIAIISAPALFWLRRRGLPTWLALFVVILGVLLIGLLMAGLVGSSVKDFSRDLPVYEDKLKQQVGVVTEWLKGFGVHVANLDLTELFNPGAAMTLAAGLLNGIGNALANGFLILMTVIFILLEASSFPAKLRKAFGSGQGSLSRFDRFISNVKNYMAIKTWVSIATGILVALWLKILGVDYPLLWGVLAFAFNYIPNIGSIISAIPAVLLAVVQLGLVKAAMAAAGYLAINIVMGSVIEPRYMGRGLGLSTLVVFLSLVFWGWVLGPVGMLLSVPLTITAKMALESRDQLRWAAVLLGPEVPSVSSAEEDDPSDSDSKEGSNKRQ